MMDSEHHYCSFLRLGREVVEQGRPLFFYVNDERSDLVKPAEKFLTVGLNRNTGGSVV
jgi:hypothetical protein